MPELPEVESIRIGLDKSIRGQVILNIKINNLKIVSSYSNKRLNSIKKGQEFIDNLKDKKIISLKRRAKNIIIEMEDKSIILIHLKMTGQIVYLPVIKSDIGVTSESQNVIGGHPIIESYKNKLPNKHTHIIFELTKGFLYYNDIRKFGYVLYYSNIQEAVNNNHFSKLGLEPLSSEFTLDYFREEVKSKNNANKVLKKVFLDQSIVVGLGNIYADEVCFASGVLGSNKLKDLTDKQIKSLFDNIKLILLKAVKMGGSSISDYLLADGSKGNYAREHKVYGRVGQKCLNQNCTNILKKEIIAGRTTIFCDICQK